MSKLLILAAIFPCYRALTCISCKNEACNGREMIETRCQVDSDRCYVMEFENGSKSRGCAGKDFDELLCRNLNGRRATGYLSDNYCALCRGFRCNEKFDYASFFPPLEKKIKCFNCSGKFCNETVDCDQDECYTIRKREGESEWIEQGCRKDERALNLSYCYDDLKNDDDPATSCNICNENLCNAERSGKVQLKCYKCKGALCFNKPYANETCHVSDIGCYRLLKYGQVLGRGCGHEDELNELCDVTKKRAFCGICKTDFCNSTTEHGFPLATVLIVLSALLLYNYVKF